MITNRLYYDDSYLREFDARVVDAEENCIALDQSAFYPTSGGQPYDTGVLETEDGSVNVLDVTVENNVVWHKVSRPLPVGTRVHGVIDWPRRFEHMQQHAADHMLAGAAWELYGGVTIGLHLGQEESTIDMTLPGGRTHLTEEEEMTLEQLVNARVQHNDEIRCWFPDGEELETLPLRKKPTVSEHIRVVAMGDYEMVACGGTHPKTTGELGLIKIISTAPARGKMRLTFVAGMRAVRYAEKAIKCARTLSTALSADFDTAEEALIRERESALGEKREMKLSLTQAALETVRREKHGTALGTVYAAALPFGDNDTLIHVASAITKEPSSAVLLLCPRKDAYAAVFARGQGMNLDMAKLLRDSGARGGGKPDMAQGSCANTDILQTALAICMQSKGE